MADSLVLKGVKDVRKHTGTEMLLLHPLRGGNTHQVKEWWRNSVNTTYTACTIFRVTTADGSVKLVLDTSNEDADIRIDHDGNFNFTFYNVNEVSRAALFTDAMELIEHYVFPSMSGGKIMTVTPAGAADRPSAPPPAEEIGTVVIAGNNTPTAGDTGIHYVAAVSGGTATDPTYTWSVVGDATIAAGQGTQQATLDFGAAGEVTLTVSVAKVGASNTPQTDDFVINTQVVFSALVAAANFSYAVTVDNGEFELDGVANAGIAGNAGDTFHFDLSDASNAGHPLKIYADAGKVTEVTVGVSQEGDDLLFTPPIAGTFYYQCANHADMGGQIVVS